MGQEHRALGGPAVDEGVVLSQNPHVDDEFTALRYIRWANKHATPKRHFAANSKICRPDYLPNVA